LKNNQTSPSHATQEKFTSPNPLKKPLFEKGGIAPSLPSPPHPKKPFWKRKKKVPNLSSPCLKAPLITCNSFNLIELSTPYTH
jgi:hypothetical protein